MMIRVIETKVAKLFNSPRRTVHTSDFAADSKRTRQKKSSEREFRTKNIQTKTQSNIILHQKISYALVVYKKKRKKKKIELSNSLFKARKTEKLLTATEYRNE